MIQDSSLLDWKNLRDDEIEMLVDLSSLLSLNLFQRVTMILSSGWFDSKVVFSVIFFYNALGESLMASSGFVYLWKIPTPPGMLHFTWTAVLAGILTRAHLKKFIRKKFFNGNAYYVFAKTGQGQTFVHLLLRCPGTNTGKDTDMGIYNSAILKN